MFSTYTSAAPALKTITKYLAASNYYLHTGAGGKEAFARADAYEKRAMNNLKALAKGTIDLVDQDGAKVPERANYDAVLSNTKDYSETFGEDDPLHWKVDPDKLDDIEDERE